MDLYDLAWRASVNERFALLRREARDQLARARGVPRKKIPIAEADEFLRQNWYRIPWPLVDLVFRAVESRQRRVRSLRPRGLYMRANHGR